MKRILAASVAAATALSLSVTAATAADKTSSEVTDAETGWHLTKAVAKEAFGQDGFASSIDVAGDIASSKADDVTSSDIKTLTEISQSDFGTSSGKALWSTFKSDTANDWKPGTTLDIIFGVTIGAIVALIVGGGAYAADQAGLIDLPF